MKTEDGYDYKLCPIDEAAELFKRKWNILIIRDMMFGKKHFNEFKEGKEGLSNKVLSQCLQDLQENGLITRKLIDTNPPSTEYHLTTYGKSLNKVIYEMGMFMLDNLSEEEIGDSKENVKENLVRDLHIDD